MDWCMDWHMDWQPANSLAQNYIDTVHDMMCVCVCWDLFGYNDNYIEAVDRTYTLTHVLTSRGLRYQVWPDIRSKDPHLNGGKNLDGWGGVPAWWSCVESIVMSCQCFSDRVHHIISDAWDSPWWQTDFRWFMQQKTHLPTFPTTISSRCLVVNNWSGYQGS